MSLYYHLRRKLFPNGTWEFTPQFRLEGRARTTGSDSNSLAMRVADPLWMLGRQWQFGEFQAEDNGSPTQVAAYYNKEKTEQFTLGKNPQKYPLSGVPLEAKVEAMPLAEKPTELDLKSRVRIGQHFEALLLQHLPGNTKEAAINGFRGLYPLAQPNPIDSASLRFFKLMEKKVIDGGKLIFDIKAKNTPWDVGKNYPIWLGSVSNDVRGKVATRLESWYDQFYVVPAATSNAWDDTHLCHKFKVHNAAGNIQLNAPDYQSGHLDWYSFDSAQVRKNVAVSTNDVRGLVPLNVSFPSMPAKRLFAFEDSKIDLTQMNIESGELIKVMLLDFALVSGSDWYTVPMEMELGEMCWIEKIQVSDVFGVTTTINNDKDKGAILNADPLKVWDIFKIRNTNVVTYNKDEHFLYLAPAATKRMESEPLEELLFVRDEYANMVWAIERRVTNAMGNPVDGYGQHTELKGSYLKSEKLQNGLPQYRLASTVPYNWIPYLPQQIGNSVDQIQLVKAVMMRNEDAIQQTVTEPLTRLAVKDILKVREEAIPKAGVRVQVTNQRVRWTDGKTYVWRSRKVLAGKGEGNSGLRFDYLKE